MSQPTTSLSVRKILACEPAFAFRAWTEPALFQQWFVPAPGVRTTAEIDPRVGGRYRIHHENPAEPSCGDVGGEFLVVDPPRRLEFTWAHEQRTGPGRGDTTLVRVTFTALAAQRTEIVLTHERFTSDHDRAEHAKGWTAVLDSIAAIIAAGALA